VGRWRLIGKPPSESKALRGGDRFYYASCCTIAAAAQEIGVGWLAWAHFGRCRGCAKDWGQYRGSGYEDVTLNHRNIPRGSSVTGLSGSEIRDQAIGLIPSLDIA
jgi:hypothetical protein